MFEEDIFHKIHQRKEVGFNIYYNNIYQTRADILKKNFPITCAFLGEEFFKQISLYYVKYQIQQITLIYMVDFSKFLSNLSECKKYPYLKEMNHRIFIFDTFSKPNIIPADINTIENNLKHIFIHPACTLFKASYDIKNIMAYVMDPPNNKIINTKPTSSYYLLYRKNDSYEIYMKTLTQKSFHYYKIFIQKGLKIFNNTNKEKDIDIIQNI